MTDKAISYVAILDNNNVPQYTFNNEDSKLSVDLQLVMFSSLDYFDILRQTGDSTGGYLGSANVGDDIYYNYGHVFGSRLKVIIINKNFQFTDKDRPELKRITSTIHELFINDRLNPLKDSPGVSENFDRQLLEFLK